MKKYKVINFLKGYSIFTIALMHLMNFSNAGILIKAISFGGGGVHVFILCSGFGLFLSHQKNTLEYVDFLKRRFGKVWTPYAILVLLWGLWFYISSGVYPIGEVTSHILLYKMFYSDLDVSLCYPYWFISTIVQFYIFWPFIVKLYKLKGGLFIMLTMSLIWSTVVGFLGYEEDRSWGSFFLQYLWEFGLGMFVAEKVFSSQQERDSSSFIDIKKYKWSWLIAGTVLGMCATAAMAWNGGILKLYNDMPSLIGYLSLALLAYKINIPFINRFFVWANSFSYELYLVHSLVYSVLFYIIADRLPLWITLVTCFVTAYVVAWGYGKLLKHQEVNKGLNTSTS